MLKIAFIYHPATLNQELHSVHNFYFLSLYVQSRIQSSSLGHILEHVLVAIFLEAIVLKTFGLSIMENVPDTHQFDSTFTRLNGFTISSNFSYIYIKDLVNTSI